MINIFTRNKLKIGLLLSVLLLTAGLIFAGIKLFSIKSGCSSFYSGQMEFCVDEDMLYYCDEKREAALYAYNMQTGKEILVTKQQGFPYKTNHGCFYLVENQVYEIKDEQLRKLCELPEYGDFYDYAAGEILWGKRNRFEERYVVQEIFRQKEPVLEKAVLSEDTSEKLYDISGTSEGISEVVQIGDVLYIGQDSGLFRVDCKENEVTQLFDRDVMALYTDGEFIAFKGWNEPGQGGYALYFVDMENSQVQKIEGSEGNTFAEVDDGVVYYNDAAIVAYDIRNRSFQVLSEGDTYSYQDYEMAEFYGDYLILRHGYQYYFVVLDMVNGTIKRVTG